VSFFALGGEKRRTRDEKYVTSVRPINVCFT
jgi:hypothetical protein